MTEGRLLAKSLQRRKLINVLTTGEEIRLGDALDEWLHSVADRVAPTENRTDGECPTAFSGGSRDQ